MGMSSTYESREQGVDGKSAASPSSSARSTMKTYLMVTIRVRLQMIRDSAPSRSRYSGSSEKVDE